MFKITLVAMKGTTVGPKSWDYIKAVYDHAVNAGSGCVSLTEYAIRLDKLLTNIEAHNMWHVQYNDTSVQVWNQADEERRKDGAAPLLVIEKYLPF